jgi:hypothetical protein
VVVLEYVGLLFHSASERRVAEAALTHDAFEQEALPSARSGLRCCSTILPPFVYVDDVTVSIKIC